MTIEAQEQQLLAQLERRGGTCRETLWMLCRLYRETRQIDKERARTTELLGLSSDAEERALCHLHLGQLMEKEGDYIEAATLYRTALAAEPSSTPVWYFINNNLGYCLNVLGRHADAEGHLRAAIRIDPTLSNAHKNLGLCLQGLGRPADAAACFIAATRANPCDGRSLRHLEELVAAHPSLHDEVPALKADMEWCRRAVAGA